MGDAQSGWSIEVQPDASWLRSPERVYPVYVDPSYTWTAGAGNSGGDDAYVYSAGGTTTYDGSLQLSGGNYVDPATVTFGSGSKTYAHYDLSWLSGRSVSAATWNGYVLSAASFPAGYKIWAVSAAWTETGASPPRVTWNAQPATISGSSVTGSATAVSTWASSTITTMVQNWATGTWTNNGILIDHNGSGTSLNFAADESSQLQRSYIQVTYNSYPTMPTMRQPALNAYTKDTTPELSVKVKDPDGGALNGAFEIWSASTGGEGTPFGGPAVMRVLVGVRWSTRRVSLRG